MLLDQQLKNKIQDLSKCQNILENKLKESKEELKCTIVESIINMMQEDDFEHNKEYIAFLSGSDDTKIHREEWLKQLSKDEQISLLAEYSIDAEIEQGHNNWEKKIKDAQKNKDSTKKAMAVKADELIQQFRRLEVEHRENINELKALSRQKDVNIQKKSAELAKLSQKNKSDNTKSAEVVEEELKDLKAEKKKLDDKIKSLEEQSSAYKREIEDAISNIEESMKKEGIYIGSYKGVDSKDENVVANTTINPQINNVRQGTDERKPSQIAKAMMKDFENLSPRQIMQMIEHSGYSDLVNMTKNLGPLNRKKLQSVMLNRLDDMKKSLVVEYRDSTGNVRIVPQTFDRDDLKQLNNDNIEKIAKIMEVYANEYENMSVYEREVAEENMEYFKIAFLILESKDNKVDRFFRGFSQKNNRINEAINALKEFSELKGKREDKKWDKNKSLREILKVKTPIPSMDRKKRFNRSGRDDIYR